MTELLAGLYDIPGWIQLSDNHKDVLFVVYQDHSKAYEGAKLSKMV